MPTGRAIRFEQGQASPEALVTFTSGINQQLKLELGQFLDSAESIRASISKLGEEIEKNQKAKGKGKFGQRYGSA